MNPIEKLEENFKSELLNARAYKTPAGANQTNTCTTNGDYKVSQEKHTKYRLGVRILLYLIKFSRPDISNSVQELTKVNDGATEAQWKLLVLAIKYTIETKNKVLRYKIGEKSKEDRWEIKALNDSDYTEDDDTRISVTGYYLYVYGCMVSRKSRVQKSITLSSTEAEYVARTIQSQYRDSINTNDFGIHEYKNKIQER